MLALELVRAAEAAGRDKNLKKKKKQEFEDTQGRLCRTSFFERKNHGAFCTA